VSPLAPGEPGAPASIVQGGTVDVLLADGDERFRDFVRRLLGGRVRVVGEASSGTEAIMLARECRPHVVLMDLGLADPGSISATRQIKAETPGTKVVLLTAHDEETYLDATGKTGADALLPKRRVRDEVLNVVLVAGRADSAALGAPHGSGSASARRHGHGSR
jgi:two-component system response regulator DegU